LELLTSGAGYFAIPIVKSRRYNLRPCKLQSKNINKQKRKLGGAKKPSKAISAPPEALRRNRAERAAEFAKRIDKISELALKKKSEEETKDVAKRNQKITLTVNILRYKMEIPDIEIVDHDGNPRKSKSMNAARKKGQGDLNHYRDDEGHVLQVTRAHAITAKVGEIEDSLAPEKLVEGKVYMDPRSVWNINKLPHDVRQTFEFLETNSPPDAIVFTDIESFEVVEPYDRVNVMNEDDQLQYVFTPHTTAIIDFKKPISCHLYPIRITPYETFEALNYDRWSICGDACRFGDSLKVPVYQFLKEPLIRKYGENWYKQLQLLVE
jgi:hypothetical protein